MSEKEFSDESDYEGKPIDEVIRDAIAWEISANEWRKITDKLKSENDRLRKALELSKKQRKTAAALLANNIGVSREAFEANEKRFEEKINELLKG